jgi:Pyridoxamine 5'-phosphate oxidase
MTTRQGDLALLDHPVAQRLLQSTAPARLAYVWTDGTPRVVPIGFHWNGTELVLGTPPDAPKTRALRDGVKVAVSIDTDTMPYNVLQIRGGVRTDTVDGIAPEYEQMALRMQGEQAGRAWLENLRQITPRMTRVYITPEWVAIMDFQQRFPNALERAMERAAASG